MCQGRLPNKQRRIEMLFWALLEAAFFIAVIRADRERTAEQERDAKMR